METLLVILSALTVWRLTYMIQNEKGPLEIFARLQAWYWTEPHREGGVKDALRCFYCTSVWLAIVPALFLSDGMLAFWVYWFGVAALAVFIDLIHSKLEQE